MRRLTFQTTAAANGEVLIAVVALTWTLSCRYVSSFVARTKRSAGGVTVRLIAIVL